MRVQHGRGLRVATVVLAVATLAAACSPSSTDSGSLSPSGAAGPLSGGGIGLTPFAGGGQRSVLVGFFDAAEGVNASKEAASEAAWIVYTEKVTACMREQGFEYYTYPYLPEEDSGLVEPVDREGLGIVIDPGETVMSREQVVAAAKRAQEQNAAYTALLEKAALGEYYLALLGFDPADGSPPGGDGSGDVLSDEEEYIWMTGGPACDGDARRAQFDVYETAIATDQTEGIDDVLLDRLGELLERYVVEVETDAGVREVLGGYQRCMISAGWSVGLPESALELLYEPPRELVELLRAQGPDVLAGLEAGDVSLDDPQVQALRDQEVEARRAHEDCVGPVIDAVFDFDERFANEHRDVVGQYVTSGG